jgi:predicted nucleic acid-binding protein
LILIDSSGLLAALDADQQDHAAAARALRGHYGPAILSPFVLAELGYMVATRVGHEAEMALLGEVAKGAYRLEPFSAADVAAARLIIHQYSNLELGLADASILVLADRHGATDILTLDERHFRAVRGRAGRGFRLLPADL